MTCGNARAEKPAEKPVRLQTQAAGSLTDGNFALNELYTENVF